MKSENQTVPALFYSLFISKSPSFVFNPSWQSFDLLPKRAKGRPSYTGTPFFCICCFLRRRSPDHRHPVAARRQLLRISICPELPQSRSHPFRFLRDAQSAQPVNHPQRDKGG